MGKQKNLRPMLRERAGEFLGRLTPSEREALLIKCWMSHDARWFMVVAKEFGMQAANRLNQMAAHEIGKVEAGRLAHKLDLPPMNSVEDYLLAQEIFIGLLGPDLLDCQVFKVGDHKYQLHVQRCFAHTNVVQAGIAEDYQCGIFARVTGWIEAFKLDYQMTPSLGKCLKVKGRECVYRFDLKNTFCRSKAQKK